MNEADTFKISICRDDIISTDFQIQLRLVLFAKSIRHRPVSGDYEELIFNHNEELFWVYFEDSDYDEYYGLFGGGGWTRYCNVEYTDNIAFVVSFGQGYLFDIDQRQIVLQTPIDQIGSFQLHPQKQYFIACSQIELFVFSKEQLLWSSKRISSDGIKIDFMTEHEVIGRVYDFSKWVEFRLNLLTYNYECDWQCPLE